MFYLIFFIDHFDLATPNELKTGGATMVMVYIITFTVIVLLLLLIPIINKLFADFSKSVEAWCYDKLKVIRIKGMELVLPIKLLESMVRLVKGMRLVLIYTLISISGVLVLNFFPGTRGLLVSILEQFVEFIKVGWTAFLEFIPDLFALILIILVTRYSLRLLRFFSEGIKHRRIKISGVHPELIDPTYQLLRFLVVAFAIVAAFPYIPGSDSPVFRGISIFVGFLLSLGSTSLVSNIVSGIVLTYTRGLKIGDRVKIGETVGDVVDRNLLVTRVRTIKNVIITIPNSMILNNHIINYSALVPNQGLILNTTVTIGYDVPWRQVHQLLISAACATPRIQSQPQPFVLQTSLDDYYVSYELNAYTNEPAKMADTYSHLHQNIQDSFAQANVEIMSPAYTAYRNGNPLTVPNYVNSFPENGQPEIFQPANFFDEDTRPRASIIN